MQKSFLFNKQATVTFEQEYTLFSKLDLISLFTLFRFKDTINSVISIHNLRKEFIVCNM